MGNPVAPQAAIIFMNFVEQKFLSMFSDSNIYWKRYIDDVLLIYPSDMNCKDILQTANLIHKDIQFTMQTPNADGFLA